MDNLIIGETSQLSYFFPKNFHRISSRNINFDLIKKNKYDKIYILFAEQRTFLNENESFFKEVNVNLTLKVVDELKNYCNKIILYSTSELWNNYDGQICVNDKFDYNYTPYIKSKEILSNYINENKKNYLNVHIIYPFNFNSPYRKQGFLFSKIFDSLINKNLNYIGNLNFERDMVHPSIIVKNSITIEQDMVIGTGELINVWDFVNDLFHLHNLNSNDYIKSDSKHNLPNQRKNYFSKIKYSDYNELLNLTYYDIRENKSS